MNAYLGIDPSTTSTGYAVVDENGDLLEEGILRPQKTRKGKTTPFEERLAYIFPKLEHVMDRYTITAIGCEEQYRGPNVSSLKKLCYLSGMLMAGAFKREIPFTFYYPDAWRKEILGKGGVDKGRAVAWANDTYPDLNLKDNQHDLAEALAIAYHTMNEHERRES